MDLALVRTAFRPDGIFSDLREPDGELVALTLEHPYTDGLGRYAPKLPDGKYVCVKGMHQLDHMIDEFETFEVTAVPGHTGILFHRGNTMRDSSGCVLLGMGLGTINNMQAITGSKVAFNAFMALQLGVQQFTLIVTSNG